MNTSIIGRQFAITQAIYGYVTEQLKSLVSTTPLKVTSASVVFDRTSRNRFTTTLVLRCKYHTLTAEVEGFDLYLTVDTAIGKVSHQLYVISDRVHDHRGIALRDLEYARAEAAYGGEE